MTNNSSLENYFGSQLIADVFKSKYLSKHHSTPDELFEKISNKLYNVEKNYAKSMSKTDIFNYIKGFENMSFGGSILYAIGGDGEMTSLSNCFVIDSPDDSIAGIMNTLEQTAQLSKRRGGVGLRLDTIRPFDCKVGSTNGNAFGIIALMDLLSNSIRDISAGSRRGALMLACSSEYYDVEKFIDAKVDKGKVNSANISVLTSNEFMHAVRRGDTTYKVQFPLNVENPLISKEVNPSEVFNKIVKNNWTSGEPGLLFWDNFMEGSPSLHYPEYLEICTNPCGELPLSQSESCSLSSIVLPKYLIKVDNANFKLDLDTLKEDIKKLVRLSDDIIDIEKERCTIIINKLRREANPILDREIKIWEEQRRKKGGRRLGIGCMGIFDVMAYMRIPQDEMGTFIRGLQEFITVHIYKESVQLAKERGAFEGWEVGELEDTPFLQRIMQSEYMDKDTIKTWKKYGRRNIGLITYAPTGTISMMAKVSSGIEPIFFLHYERKVKVREDELNTNKYNSDSIIYDEHEKCYYSVYNVFHPAFEAYYADVFGIDLKSLPKEELNIILKDNPFIPYLANNIPTDVRLSIQANAQHWIDHSISSTINLPHTCTEEDIREIYNKAWDLKLKGVTIYRDGSRLGVITESIDKKDETTIKKNNDYKFKRAKVLDCKLTKSKRGDKDFYIIISTDKENSPKEVFVTYTKTGEPSELRPFLKYEDLVLTKIKRTKEKENSQYILSSPSCEESIDIIPIMSKDSVAFSLTRMVSVMLRNGIMMEEIEDQISKTMFNMEYQTMMRLIAKTVSSYIKEDSGYITKICDACGKTLVPRNGCWECPPESGGCGNSIC